MYQCLHFSSPHLLPATVEPFRPIQGLPPTAVSSRVHYVCTVASNTFSHALLATFQPCTFGARICWTISCNNPRSPSHCTPFSHVLITVFQLTAVRVSKCCTISSISATAPPATDGEQPASNRQPQANGCQPAASRRPPSVDTDCWPMPAGVLNLPQHSVFQSTLCSIDLSAAYNDPRIFLNPLVVSLHLMFQSTDVRQSGAGS